MNAKPTAPAAPMPAALQRDAESISALNIPDHIVSPSISEQYARLAAALQREADRASNLAWAWQHAEENYADPASAMIAAGWIKSK